eukprot:30478-Eustigmatos_ZCMA.PRE.1
MPRLLPRYGPFTERLTSPLAAGTTYCNSRSARRPFKRCADYLLTDMPMKELLSSVEPELECHN